MSNKKVLIICQSIHHGNTMKIARVIAEQLNADIKKPFEIKINNIDKYDLVGFGSGIYDDKHHKSLLDIADKSFDNNGKKAFVFSTCGAPVSLLGNNYITNYLVKSSLHN